MIKVLYKRVWAAMKGRFWKLFGLTWLGVFLSGIAGTLGGPVLGVGIGVGWLLSVGTTMIFLRGYRGETIGALQLFDYFSDWKTIKRILCGMGWMVLWVLLWTLIPVVGIVFGAIRAYEYRLVPYILATEPEVSPTEALKVSKERTMGYKGKMFGADLLWNGVYLAVEFVIGLFFGLIIETFYWWELYSVVSVINLLLIIAYTFIAPVFSGLLSAAFYDEIMKPTMNTTAYTDKFCTQCGAPLSGISNYCPRCGSQIK